MTSDHQTMLTTRTMINSRAEIQPTGVIMVMPKTIIPKQHTKGARMQAIVPKKQPLGIRQHGKVTIQQQQQQHQMINTMNPKI